MKPCLAGALFGLLAACAAGCGDETRPPEGGGALPERPNILFLFTDDHACKALGAYGAGMTETPRLDRLAREGMLFRNMVVENAICAPSRAAVLTGTFSHRHGVRTNYDVFDGSQQTFPKLLREAGYQTALIGKWHLKSKPTGFDHWEILPGQGAYYNPEMVGPRGERTYAGYVTEILTDQAIAWLRSGRDPGRPFLLMCQHKAPHRSWEPGPRQVGLYDGVEVPEPPTLFDDYRGRAGPAARQRMRIAEDLTPADLKLVAPLRLDAEQRQLWNVAYGPRNEAFRQADPRGDDLVRWKYQRYIKDYLRTVQGVDASVGRLLDALEACGLAGNTVVVYSSDQGFFLGEHGWFDKRWMYEESLHAPLIVRWPGVTAPGSESAALVQNIDLAETFLEMAGVAVPGDMQGRSLVPLLRGRTPEDWRDAIYYHYYEYPISHWVEPHVGIRTQRHKLIHFYRDPVDAWELFDLEEDPLELRSVYEDPDYASTRRELEQRLAELQALYGDPPPEAWAAAPPARPALAGDRAVVAVPGRGPWGLLLCTLVLLVALRLLRGGVRGP